MARSATVHLLDGAAGAQSVVIAEVLVAVEAAAAEVFAAAAEVRMVLAKARWWRRQPRSCK